MKEQARYVPDEEAAADGFFAEPEPAEYIEVYGLIPKLVVNPPYEAKTGEIKVVEETRELPPEDRHVVQKMGQGLDGLLHAVPTKNSDINGLQHIGKQTAQQQVIDKLPRTHAKASRKLLPIAG